MSEPDKPINLERHSSPTASDAPSWTWSDVAARVFIVAVLLFIFWLVRVRL